MTTKINRMKLKKKKEYSKPDLLVFRISVERPLLTMSGKGVSLKNAGVDESEADDNGTDLWGN